MASVITIPRLGWNMEEGTFLGWLKADGEHVRAGEPLFVLEGEKATQEIEANDAGILRVSPTAPATGERVAVGVRIGSILQAGEEHHVETSPAAAASHSLSFPTRDRTPSARSGY